MKTEIVWVATGSGLPPETETVLVAYDEGGDNLEIRSAYLMDGEFYHTCPVNNGSDYLVEPQPEYWAISVGLPNA